MCWLAEVAECRFLVRHRYKRSRDLAEARRVHQDLLAAFEKVTQWQDKGYMKPKFHVGEHYAEALEEWGPFRAYWCFHGEAYLQVRHRPPGSRLHRRRPRLRLASAPPPPRLRPPSAPPPPSLLP